MHHIQQHETQDFPDPGHRLEQVQGLCILLFGRVEKGPLQIVQLAVIMVDQGEVHLEALLDRGVGKPRSDSCSVGLVCDLLPDLGQVVLAVRRLDRRQPLRPCAHASPAAPPQGSCGPQRSGIEIGLREPASAQAYRDVLGLDGVVFGFPTVDGLHVEGVPEDKGQVLSSPQVSMPVPLEDTFDSDDHIIPIGCNSLEQHLRACWHLPMHLDHAVVVQNTDRYGPGMQIDAAVKLVLVGIESPEVSSS